MSTPWQVADEIHAARVQMQERAARTEQAEAERDAAIKRAEAAERERDGFQQWANTLESAGWQDAGFCPHCGKDDVRKSIDVLEPDAAQEIRYCCSCGTAWVVGHKPPTRR